MIINSVCLITPPSIFLLDERVFMTLGILKVAAVLEQAGLTVEMLDLSCKNLSVEGFTISLASVVDLITSRRGQL